MGELDIQPRGEVDASVDGDKPMGIWEQLSEGWFVYLMAQVHQPNGQVISD